MNAPQITPVTALQRSYSDVLKKLVNGPVFLAQRSSPVAAMMSIADYERLAQAEKEMKRLQRIIQYDHDFAEMRQGKYTEG
jgi:prevent-host-death family protein